jgi:hypothetical protein
MPDPRDAENEASSVRTDGAELRACRACGAPLMLVAGPNQRKIPLDLRAGHVYRVRKDLLGNAVAELEPEAFVSHFRTCPAAGDFSGARKR